MVSPPELGACDASVLNATLKPTNGNSVDIVAYAVAGTLDHPDPFNSYFILENNWGTDAGYHSFYYMNFAALKYLVWQLFTNALI